MLAFIDAGDGYYQFDDTAPQSMYSHLTPCALRVPIPPTAQQQRDAIQAQIDALEAKTIMNRFVREWSIKSAVIEAAKVGATEPMLYASSKGYRDIKDMDTLITNLRNQMCNIVG